MEATCNLARLVATSDGSDEEVTPHCHTRLIPRAFSTCAYCIRQTKRYRLSLCPNPSLSEAHRAAEARDLGTPGATPNRRSDPTRALPGGPLSTPPYSGGHALFPTPMRAVLRGNQSCRGSRSIPANYLPDLSNGFSGPAGVDPCQGSAPSAFPRPNIPEHGGHGRCQGRWFSNLQLCSGSSHS
jgi:hypothetical protein